jgi:HlyD family secretion protein
MRSSRRLRTAVFVGVLLVSTVLWTLVSLRSPAGLTVTSAAVTIGDIVHHVTLPGVVEPETTVDIASQVPGTIADVDVDSGAAVRAGQILLRLERGGDESALEAARIRLADARAESSQARAVADRATATLYQSQHAASLDLIAAADLDRLRTAAILADEAAETAEQRVRDAAADVRDTSAEVQAAVVRSPVDGVVVSRSAEEGQAVAPAPDARPLFRVATNLEHLRVTINVEARDVASLTVGAPATIAVDGPSQTYKAHVEAILPDPGMAAASDGPTVPVDGESGSTAPVTYPVVFAFEDPRGAVRPGTTVLVSFDGERAVRARRVPSAALQFEPSADVFEAAHEKAPLALETSETKSGQAARVWAYDGTEFVPIQIDIGLSDDQWTELVRGPLEAGATVVTGASIRRGSRAE